MIPDAAHAVIPLDWMTDAACTTTDPEAFFPDKGGTLGPAVKVCQTCDVVAQCLAYAQDNEERYGVWGGLAVRARRKLRRAA